jgi:tripartite-type tricarboxylate transporter receptor subunit TctC
MGKVGYHSVTSFTHLGHVCGSGSLLVVHEAGVKGFDSTAWYGLLGPAGLPAEAVTRLTQALAKAGADKTLRDQINATGCDTGILSAAQTVEKIRADYAKWGRAVKEANIKAE